MLVQLATLMRGLDYYTDVIYEAIINDSPTVQNEEQVSVGSVAAGDRYDNLVGMFSGNQQIPCISVSIGVERIFAIALARQAQSAIKANATQVHVIGLGPSFLKERMAICAQLWNANVKVKYMFKQKPSSLKQQFEVCDKEQIPLAIILGKQEVEAGVVKVRKMSKDSAEASNREVTIQRGDLVKTIRTMLQNM
ncbi:hypothetical protein DFJ77DRAFT_507131 [Powellomyces hirtus]|nr:hypothetical protein DFJ77DRAFT_507131 [Powellomyces hirtus]